MKDSFVRTNTLFVEKDFHRSEKMLLNNYIELLYKERTHITFNSKLQNQKLSPEFGYNSQKLTIPIHIMCLYLLFK